MELEGVRYNTPRVKHAEDLEPILPEIARPKTRTSDAEWSSLKKVPKAYVGDGSTSELSEYSAQVKDPHAEDSSEEEMLTYIPKAPIRTAMRSPNEPLACKKMVHIDSRPSVHLADYAYDRRTTWGGETPHYSEEYKKMMAKEVEQLRGELFPNGGAFGDRHIDLHDPSVARTHAPKVHVVKEAKLEAFDSTDWPVDDFY